MDVCDTGYELIGKEENRLQGEFTVAEVEEVLQAGSEQVEDHCIVVTLGSEPPDVRNTDTAGKGLVHTSLMFKLRTLGLDALKLDGNLLARDHVFSEVDFTEAAAADLTTDTVFVTDAKILEEELYQHTGLSPND